VSSIIHRVERELQEASMFVESEVKIDHGTREAVTTLLQARGDVRSLQPVVDEALKAWLQKASCEDPAAAQAAARGYLWKSLFLPEGTLLRFNYRAETYIAQVQGDHIIYQGAPYSPRQLLIHLTGNVRNAWTELWLRCPGDNRWHLADTRRHILRRTPRGRHPRGIDTEQVNIDARAQLAARLAVGEPNGFLGPHYKYMAAHAAEAARLRAFLYRDDLVRDDQPDLASKRGGANRDRAGRAGPRERRWTNLKFYRTFLSLPTGDASVPAPP
jgi:hypothetical protein